MTEHLTLLPRVSVLLPHRLGLLTYAADRPIAPGTVVAAPLGGRSLIGVVWDDPPDDAIDDARLKAVKPLRNSGDAERGPASVRRLRGPLHDDAARRDPADDPAHARGAGRGEARKGAGARRNGPGADDRGAPPRPRCAGERADKPQGARRGGSRLPRRPRRDGEGGAPCRGDARPAGAAAARSRGRCAGAVGGTGRSGDSAQRGGRQPRLRANTAGRRHRLGQDRGLSGGGRGGAAGRPAGADPDARDRADADGRGTTDRALRHRAGRMALRPHPRLPRRPLARRRVRPGEDRRRRAVGPLPAVPRPRRRHRRRGA